MSRLAGILCLVSVCAWGASTNYYVATDGNDSNVGSLASPFLTLGKAQTTLRAEGPFSDGATVYVRGGTYLLQSSFALTGDDSGVDYNNPIVWRGYPGETARILGALPLTNWQVYSGEIRTVDASTQGIGTVNFRQLFFNGTRQTLARRPNYDPNDPIYGGWSLMKNVKDSTDATNYYSFAYETSAVGTWPSASVKEVFFFPGSGSWWNKISTITNIDTVNKFIQFTTPDSQMCYSNNRYFIQNVFEELDTGGEWYLNITNHVVYFWPIAPFAPSASVPVYVPIVGDLVTFAAGTSNVTWRNFTMQHCSNDVVTVTGCTNIVIAANRISHAADFNTFGVTIVGGYTNGVVGNDISYIGSDGIKMTGGNIWTLTPCNNYADNNYIHHCGVYNKRAPGVELEVAVGARVSRNTIHSCPRAGVYFNDACNSKIESNHIYQVSIEADDTGAVYASSGYHWLANRGASISYNFIHTASGYGFYEGTNFPTGQRFGAHGIYMDGLCMGHDVIGNVIYDTAFTGIISNGGRDNWIRNNIIYSVDDIQIDVLTYLTNNSYWTARYTAMVNNYTNAMTNAVWGAMRGMSVGPTNNWFNGWTVAGTDVSTNVVVFTNKIPSVYWHQDEGVRTAYYYVHPGSNTWDYNVYYPSGTTNMFTGTNVNQWTLAEWQANSAADDNSVETDPQLDTTTWQLGSPSFGFQQLYPLSWGAYLSTNRASWPLGSAGPANILDMRATTFNVGTMTLQ